MNYAILLSGGTGRRVGTEVPKQYVRSAGYLMVTYALSSLLKSNRVDAVYIVAEHEWRELIIADAESAGLNVAKIKGYAVPGLNRQISILNGLQEIVLHMDGTNDIDSVGNKDTVMLHDAARPFLTEKMISDCYDALSGHDGVMPVLPMKDTIYRSKDGVSVSGLLDREQIFAGQAPELFFMGKYLRANMLLMPDKIFKICGATEPAIMADMDILMIPGDESNYKVTTKEDMEKFQEDTKGIRL